MATTKITVKLTQPMADFVEQMVGPAGPYETPGEYIRDLIRQDMERRTRQSVRAAILAGYRDLADGAVFTSTGDFATDMVLLERKEASGWQ